MDFDHTDIAAIKEKVSHVFLAIKNWMLSRRLKINASKTKILVFCPDSKKSKVYAEIGNFSLDGGLFPFLIKPKTLV